VTDHPDPRKPGAPEDGAGGPDPWRSFRGVMAGTLILEAIVVLLALPVVASADGGLTPLTGGYDDGYGGLLGWFWLACAATTGGLVVVTRLALRERAYSAVMAATGLLYLAILTAAGTDLVARALLAS